MKILVIRFSSIGDIVLTSPVTRCLKKQLNAEVHFLTKKAFASIQEASPFIDRVYAIEKSPTEVLKDLKNEQYDHIIDLHHNLRSLRVKLALGKPASSFNKLNKEKWMRVNLGIDMLPRTHIVDRYMETVDHLGVHNDGEGLDYFIPEKDIITPRVLDYTLSERGYIAFVIGATHHTKRLTRKKMLEICNGMAVPTVILGGKQEAEDGEWLEKNAGTHVLNLCGKLNLNQSASMVKYASVVVTHDTGLMHIAAALRKKVVCIWGNTIPEFGMYPYYPDGMKLHTNVQVAGLSCRPCSKIGHEKCPEGHFKCMERQNVDLILSEIQSCLQS
ncbi:MAG: hypothetical protein RJA20_5 [Bacteroidota bacterium]|jgi:ADP-heptose:LPS heptosyltransferase